MKRLIVFLSLIMLFASSCSKQNVTDVRPTQGTVRAKGTLKGDVVSKEIGEAGGSISSADGRLALDIPAGALAANTVISIQSISSTLPMGVGNGYRLNPEGQIFYRPVTITFKYEDSALRGSSSRLLYVAYQDESGIWKAINDCVRNSSDNTISGMANHFSDWTIFESYKMKVSDNPIYVNRSTLLTVCQMKMWNVFGETVLLGDTLTVPSNAVTNWKLQGDGILLPLGAGTVYEAPAVKPVPNPVTVSADIENVKDANGETIGKLTLLADILVLDGDTSSNGSGGTNDEGHMDFNFKGTDYSFPICFAVYDESHQTFGISAAATLSNNLAGSAGIIFSSTTEGKFLFGDLNLPGHSHIEVAFSSDYKTYYSQYNNCQTNSGVLYNIGSISCTGIGSVNGYVSGSFTGTLVHVNPDCTYDFQNINGTFKAKRVG